jgi:type IV pilus assembly protein PilA
MPHAGVTLIELMIVVSIIGVATALAVPSYTNWNARSQLRDAVTELHSNLNIARMMAMNRNTTITVTLLLQNTRVNATFTTPGTTSNTCLTNSGACVWPTQQMPGEVTGVTVLSGGTAQPLPAAVQFNSLGLLQGVGNNTQTIRLRNSRGTTFEIQVTRAGKARWCTVSPCP